MDWRIIALAASGVVIGLIYILNGGRTPQWLLFCWDLVSPGELKDDDDPKNLSPRVFLPILIAAILVGLLMTWIVLWP